MMNIKRELLENNDLNRISKILLSLCFFDFGIALFCYYTLYTNINVFSTGAASEKLIILIMVFFLFLFILKISEVYKIKKIIDKKDEMIESNLNREILLREKEKAVDKYNTIKAFHAEGNYDDIISFCNENLEKEESDLEDVCDSVCLNAIISTYCKKTAATDIAFEYTCLENIEEYNQTTGLDSKLLNTVLGNLLDNAIEAIRSNKIESPLIKLKIGVTENEIYYIVENNGPKIKNITKIFNSRFSTKGKGRGMGLVAVIRLLEEYSGTVDVMSNDQTTMFDVRFNHYM